jgi:hypothetical protein
LSARLKYAVPDLNTIRDLNEEGICSTLGDALSQATFVAFLFGACLVLCGLASAAPTITLNPDLVSPLLADKFVNTASDGKVTGKAESLAAAKATKYDSVAYDDVKVTAFGGTAIATGDFKAKGTDASGKPLDVHERFTDTWVKIPTGQWQCVASHQSPVKM